MNAAIPIVSRYGKRVTKWDSATLGKVLAQLRHERKSADCRHEMPDNNGDDSQRLIAEAEQIRDNANHILATDMTQ